MKGNEGGNSGGGNNADERKDQKVEKIREEKGKEEKGKDEKGKDEKGKDKKGKDKKGKEEERTVVFDDNEMPPAQNLDLLGPDEDEIQHFSIADFGTIMEVPYDGNCGYISVIRALKDINKYCREDVKEFRRDIRNYIRNHKSKDKKADDDFRFVMESDFDSIFVERLKYTENVGYNHWMDGGIVGQAIANLFNVAVYIYSIQKRKRDRKEGKTRAAKKGKNLLEEKEDEWEVICGPRTQVYCPFEEGEIKEGYIPIMNKDRLKKVETIRLYN